jgi:hypothetical protein
MSQITIPEVSYNSPFGKVNKAVWFKPQTNNSGIFKVELLVIPNVTLSTNISINNLAQNVQVYNNRFLPNASQAPINKTVTITHNPNTLSQYYVLLNISQ